MFIFVYYITCLTKTQGSAVQNKRLHDITIFGIQKDAHRYSFVEQGVPPCAIFAEVEEKKNAPDLTIRSISYAF